MWDTSRPTGSTTIYLGSHGHSGHANPEQRPTPDRCSSRKTCLPLHAAIVVAVDARLPDGGKRWAREAVRCNGFGSIACGPGCHW